MLVRPRQPAHRGHGEGGEVLAQPLAQEDQAPGRVWGTREQFSRQHVVKKMNGKFWYFETALWIRERCNADPDDGSASISMRIRIQGIEH